jgi:hypothetical protein
VVKNRFAFALPVALFGVALLAGVGCGSSTGTTDAGGGSGGKGGNTAGTTGGGTGGSAAGTGGSAAGAGGGTGGSVAGTGGSAAGTSGGAGGSVAGTSGGTGGSVAGAGGSAAGTSGGGTAGSAAGHGGTAGNAAGHGGSAAGAGGGGGNAGTGGGAGHVTTDAGSDAHKDAEADAHKDAESDAHDAAPVCTSACTLGARRCASGGSETCVLGANGCTEWGSASICSGVQTCASSTGLCACPAGPSGCTAAGTFCSGPDLVSCLQDAQGCFSETTPATCPTDTSCKGSLPTAACTCDNDAMCNGANSFCMDPSTVATCGFDSNTPACNIIKSTTTCGGSSFCSGGACVCPALGTTAGTGCATLNATSCSGTDILTCVTEAASGCSLWQASTHCSTTGLTCGTKASATSACQCPENTGTDVYVDPTPGTGGSDTASGVFPTGIQTPPTCRYASLTKGLSKVGAPGRVIAISATLPATQLEGETFPMNIPAGVTVMTADAVFNPADYLIAFNTNGPTTAITLASGSSLQGFTVQSQNGTVGAALVSCSGGSVVLDSLQLDGGGQASDGVDVLGSCSPSLNKVGIGNLTGVALRVSSTAATTVTGGLFNDNTMGVQQTSGLVSLTGLTIQGSGQYGILLPASSSGMPSVSLAGETVVSGNGTLGTFAGISVGKGSLTASNTTVDNNGGIGIQLTSAGSTHQLTTVEASNNGSQTSSVGVGLTAGTLTASGLTASHNTSSGISVSGGSATLTGSSVSSNGVDGLVVSGGTVTVSGGSFDSNATDGILGTAGVLNVQDGTELATNTEHGLELTGAITVVAGANIHNNSNNGILVNDASGVTVNIGPTSTTVNGNGNDGIQVGGSPATGGGANSLTVDTVAIGSNGRFGVYLQGNNASIAATLKGSTVTTNGGVGIMVEQSGVHTTTAAIQNNDVNGNNTGSGHSVGGILFNTSSTLSSFIGNKVHSNVGDELGFAAPPNGGLRWVINPPSAACDSTANSLYCYGNGNVGLHILNGGGVTVDGQHVHWTNNPPTSGIDYSGTVTVTNPCTSVTVCP